MSEQERQAVENVIASWETFGALRGTTEERKAREEMDEAVDELRVLIGRER
jgi:hypothetical protein